MPVDIAEVEARIQGRIDRLADMYRVYELYQADRVAEGDHHAVRDVACDLDLTRSEMAGLEFALAEVVVFRNLSKAQEVGA